MSNIEETLVGNASYFPAPTDEAAKANQETKTEPEKEVEVKAEPTPEEAEKARRQAEIDDVVSKRLARERKKFDRQMAEERERHNRDLAELRAQATKPSTPKPTGRPTSEGFDTQEEYLEALTDWKLEQREKAAAEQAAKKEQTHHVEEVSKAWAKKLEKAHKDHPDLEDLLEDNDTPVSQAMAEAVIDSDIGGDILHYLASHPEEAESIAKLPPLRAAKEIGKIELKLTKTEDKKKEEPETKKPPAPLTPVKGSAHSAEPKNDQDWYEQELAKRRARK